MGPNEIRIELFPFANEHPRKFTEIDLLETAGQLDDFTRSNANKFTYFLERIQN